MLNENMYLTRTTAGNSLLSIEDSEVNNGTFEAFINYIDAKPKTVATYTRAIKQFASYLEANGITQPTQQDIRAYRDSIKDTHKPATVQAYIFAVRRFFSFTESSGIYPNVAGKIKGAKIDRSPKKDYLTSEQAKQVLKSIDTSTIQGIRDYAILLLMITCGLRDIEVSRANIEDMRTAGNNSVLYIQGKGKDERNDYVILPAQTEEAIRRYLLKAGKNKQTGDKPIFTSTSNNSNGQRLTTRSISGIVKATLRANGYDSDHLTAHSLRHTAITLALIANGGNIQEAQEFARHANISTTQIYAHNLDKTKNSCSRLVASSLF